MGGGNFYEALLNMEQISFQILRSETDLKIYQQKTAEQVGVELPLSYLREARVIGLKNKDTGEICGGFTMAFTGSLRCIEQLPEEVKETNFYLNKFKDRFFEINGLWLNHAEAPANGRLQLYLQCMQQASLLTIKGKSKYVYAYCADNQKLRDFYRNFNSKEIYEGPIRPLPGMKEAARERVEMGCMIQLPWTIIRNPGFLVQRASNSPYKVLQGTFQKVADFKARKAL